MESKEIAINIAKVLHQKKAEKIDVLMVSHRTVITDYLVIASGTSYPHVRALMDEVEDKLAKEGVYPVRKEGMQEARWGVLDYNYVMVHIFHQHERDFYKLDSLWADDTNRVELDFKKDNDED